MSVNKDIVTVQAVAETSLYSENSKLRQTDAVEYFKTLLKRNNLVTSKCSSSIAHEAMLMEVELYNYAVDMLVEKKRLLVKVEASQGLCFVTGVMSSFKRNGVEFM
ncbi:uncharacterized protein TNIN_370861 [Trichonephila inaurata madagascariensis]|uniref:Uncharacterized protein n=1 Tax=Trichonephila inaurata madagascariensis TaxID=2747483 RepID=A0A8X6JB33_9ARAC|nr:uncharacterized protein TNIN_370861 [Trichonephila inaurata madagascariensis]